MNPTVTVLMPTYNAEAFLVEALQSILSQTWKDFEFLIVNDASSDATPQILAQTQDPRIRIIQNPTRLGVTGSLNRGLSEARGQIVCRMDADDISDPERIHLQTEHLLKEPKAGLVSSLYEFIDEKDLKVRTFKRPSLDPVLIHWNLLFRNYLGGHGQVAFKIDLARKVGGYSSELPYSQDYDLWLRLARVTEVHILTESLFKRRIHKDAIGTQKRAEQLQCSIETAKTALREVTGREISEKEILLLRKFMSSFFEAKKEFPSFEELSQLERNLREIKSGFFESPFGRPFSSAHNRLKVKNEVSLQYWRLARRSQRAGHFKMACLCAKQGLNWAPLSLLGTFSKTN